MIEFRQYWQDIASDHRDFAERQGLDFEQIDKGNEVQANGHSWRVDWLRYSSVDESLIYGWVARPIDQSSQGEVFVWLPGYSYGTPPPDVSNLVAGVTTVCINLHGNQPDQEYINPAGQDDYIADGIESPQTYIFRKITLHCLLAIDVAGRLDGVDPEKIAVGGMSQGGGLALIVAANHPSVKVCFSDMPFFCDLRESLPTNHRAAYKALRDAIDSDEDKLSTACLFDPLYHAPNLKVPVHITAGGKDPASRAETIRPVYLEAGSSFKAFRFFPKAGHIFVKEMPQIYRDWMDLVFAND